MICDKCQSIFPAYYKECPVCCSSEFKKEQFAKQPDEIVEYEPVSAYVMGGELKGEELSEE